MEVCRLLEHRGFVMVRRRGSPAQYRHPDGRSTTVLMHTAEPVGVTTKAGCARPRAQQRASDDHP